MTVLSLTLGLTGCNNWIHEDTPGSSHLEDYLNGGEAAMQLVNGCYSPLAWEYNPGGYFSEWYFGDIASDDALKGGQDVSDGAEAYDIDNFKVNANNAICLNYYRAKYQGIIRCNLAIRDLPGVDPDEFMNQERKDCMLGEVYFMRAFYYFQLARVFGGVPLVDEVLDSSSKWIQNRASQDDVYRHVAADLIKAEKLLWNKSRFSPEDLGRATKGAAQAMLCKVYLYMKDYENAYIWGKKFVDEQYNSGEYSLCARYADNFTLAGENGPESVFEIQYMAEPTSDYGEGFGFTRGTFTTILVRPRSSKLGSTKGWGWNHPTRNLYDEYEANDIRRDVTIGVPDSEELEEVEMTYLGSPYFNKKYSYCEDDQYPPLDHDSRSPLNYRLIRASDVLLMYAEAALESNRDINAAKWALEQVRRRARIDSGVDGVLPEFPGYNGYSDNVESLRAAIRHERRVELAMEGHRWFDIVRWGIAASVMDKNTGSYGSHESDEARAEMASFIEGKNELFPIPAEEINLNPMPQNPGY